MGRSTLATLGAQPMMGQQSREHSRTQARGIIAQNKRMTPDLEALCSLLLRLWSAGTACVRMALFHSGLVRFLDLLKVALCQHHVHQELCFCLPGPCAL